MHRTDLMQSAQCNADQAKSVTIPMTPSSSPPGVPCSSHLDEAWSSRCVGTNGTAQGLLHSVLQPEVPQPPTVGIYGIASEELNPATMKHGGEEEEGRVFAGYGGPGDGPGSDEQELKQRDDLDDPGSSTHAAALHPVYSNEALQKLEHLPVNQFQEDSLMVLNPNEVPASGGEQHTTQEVHTSQGEVLKQEVARRSQIFGNLTELDENSARQLLTDSGWNVSQCVRKGGQTQWYYRTPPPKATLLGSLTSAVAMWKKLVDEDHKRRGGGDDPYPMVTAFLNNVKKPDGKKRKRGRPNRNS